MKLVLSQSDFLDAILTWVPPSVLKNELKDHLSDEEITSLTREGLQEILNSIPDSKRNALRKTASRLELKGDWLSYRFERKPTVVPQKIQKSKIDVTDFFDAPTSKVTASILLFTIFEDIYVIVVEFSSRSKYYRTRFRYFIIPENKLILYEKREGSRELFEELIAKNLDGGKITEARINARMIRKVNISFKTTQLTFLANTETSGTEGLSTLTVKGPDVKRGMETLKSRQEVDLSLLGLGPWISTETDTIRLTVRKGLEILAIKEEIVKVLQVCFP